MLLPCLGAKKFWGSIKQSFLKSCSSTQMGLSRQKRRRNRDDCPTIAATSGQPGYSVVYSALLSRFLYWKGRLSLPKTLRLPQRRSGLNYTFIDPSGQLVSKPFHLCFFHAKKTSTFSSFLNTIFSHLAISRRYKSVPSSDVEPGEKVGCSLCLLRFSQVSTFAKRRVMFLEPPYAYVRLLRDKNLKFCWTLG